MNGASALCSSSTFPGIPLPCRTSLNPIVREFRRASSAAIDASLKPMMGAYMASLEQRLKEAGFSGASWSSPPRAA